MATLDMQRFQRGDMTASSPSMPAQQTARRMTGAGNTLSGTNAVNEQLAMMKSPQQLASSARAVARQFDTPAQRAQFAQQFVTRNAMQLGQQEPQRVNIRNSLGVAVDDQFVNDLPYYSPEARLAVQEARRQVQQELSGMFAGANTEAWKRTTDLEDAVNQLPSVQRFAPLVESFVQGMVRNNIDHGMKTRFEVDDRNRDSFVQWAQDRGIVDSPEAPVSAMYDQNQELRRQFEQDPNAIKFDVDPRGQIVQRQLTPEQQTAQRIGLQTGLDEAQFNINRQRTQQVLQNNPELAATMMEGPDGNLIPRPAQPQTRADIERVAQTNNSIREQQGIRERDIVLEDPRKPGSFITETIQLPPESFYKDIGNDLFKRQSPEQQDKIVASILESEAMVESTMDLTAAAKFKAQASVARRRFGLEGANLYGDADGEQQKTGMPTQQDLEKRLGRKLTPEEIAYLNGGGR